METVTIAPGHSLRVDAGESYLRARKHNPNLPAGITSSTRSRSVQMQMYLDYKAGRPGANFALHPDESNHVKGTALDLPGDVNNSHTPRGWMKKFGGWYGWEPVTSEPWHFNYVPKNDKSRPKEKPEMSPEESATLKLINERTATMNARQIIMLNEQRAADGKPGLDPNALATQIAEALNDILVDAIADELTSRGIGDPHTIAVAVTSRLANKLA